MRGMDTICLIIRHGTPNEKMKRFSVSFNLWFQNLLGKVSSVDAVVLLSSSQDLICGFLLFNLVANMEFTSKIRHLRVESDVEALETKHYRVRGEEDMGSLATAEVCDTNAALVAVGDIRVLPPIFKTYGQCRAFSGPIVTLKVFEDNVLVRELLETKGEGRILVIDGGGSMRCALVGGNLGQLAQNMGWNGIVVNGCIRDVDEINGCDVGVRALASHPQKSYKRGIGEKHVPVNIAGTLIHDGEWLYADSDGILISKGELSL
ncbi:hypothetical protein SASPL_143547 [Salvia splendens]|uniref:4-hydroxy-4-methyl-2-oxoglutarate aldolase n=2 Tax=Salvia splendens TaxID=180675 RepID=A0A8X8WL33_SALSN|nr:hypothetical protein SASPL_143547 [Salvia splendens]